MVATPLALAMLQPHEAVLQNWTSGGAQQQVTFQKGGFSLKQQVSSGGSSEGSPMPAVWELAAAGYVAGYRRLAGRGTGNNTRWTRKGEGGGEGRSST